MVEDLLGITSGDRADNGLQGLKLHLEACHDRFVYGFCEDHPDVAPAIHVACAEELQFVQQETGQGNLQSAIVQVSY